MKQTYHQIMLIQKLSGKTAGLICSVYLVAIIGNAEDCAL